MRKKERKTKKGEPSKKTKKDDNAPKRPAGGAYGQYLATKREEIKKMLPADHKITDVTKKASALWKALPAVEKEKFETMYKTANDSYQEAMKEYKATKAAQAPETEAIATPSSKKRKANAAQALEAEANEKPSPKKRKVANSSKSTPTSSVASRKGSKSAQTVGVDIGDDVLTQARAAGYESQLKNLAARPDVVKSGKKDSDLLKALNDSNGLVNPAKRALLGA